jgi:hypothetical protein
VQVDAWLRALGLRARRKIFAHIREDDDDRRAASMGARRAVGVASETAILMGVISSPHNREQIPLRPPRGH